VIRRIGALAAASALAATFAMAAIASGRQSRPRRSAIRLTAASNQPDQVIQWNQELQKVLVAPGAQPSSIRPTRTMAITQIAVYDAVDGMVRGGDPFLVDLRAPRSASPDAAAAAAARTALDALLPSQQPAIDAFFQNSLDQLGQLTPPAFAQAALTQTAQLLGRITRTFASFSQASDEAFASRIFTGQHFRSDEDARRALGGQLADFVVDHALQRRAHDR
jgi:hypothetical protein